MAPNLFDKLLDALGLLPFGALLRLRRLRELWRRLGRLRDTLNRIADQLRRAQDRLRDARDRMRHLAERRDALNRRLDKLRDKRRRARSSVEQRRIDDRIRRANRERDQVMDDMAPAFDDITEAEGGLRVVEAREREYDFLGKEILSGLAEFFLPMALLSCVANALGIDLFARSVSNQSGAFKVDGEYARFDGSALEGELIVLCKGHLPTAWTFTDGLGRFTFGDLPPGEYTAAALGDTLCLRRFTIETEDHEIQLGPTESMPHVVMVQNEEGQPLSDITVVLCGFNMDRVESIAIGETKARGTVCLPRHPDLNHALLVYRVSELSATLLHTDIMPSENKPYTKLRLQTRMIRGRVLDSKSGEPIDGVQVTALPLDGDYISAAFGRVVGFRATTDATGSLDVRGPKSGRYLLTLSAAGYGLLATDIKVQGEKSTHLGMFKLKPIREAGDLMGVIRDPLGQPSAGYVSLARADGRPTGHRQFADNSGTFHFKGLKPGEYYIEVQGERPSELARRKVTLHPNKRIEAIISLQHSLDMD